MRDGIFDAFVLKCATYRGLQPILNVGYLNCINLAETYTRLNKFRFEKQFLQKIILTKPSKKQRKMIAIYKLFEEDALDENNNKKGNIKITAECLLILRLRKLGLSEMGRGND